MFKEQKTNIFVPSILSVLVIFSVGLKTSTLSATEAPFYQVQTAPPFPDPPIGEFTFIENTDGVNSWAGEDPGALITVGINDDIDSQGLGVPIEGFSGQGAVVVYNVNGEAGNGAFCALSSVFPPSDGGPGGSGLPLNLNDVVLRVDIAFDVPDHPEVTSLSRALNFWVQEVDGDNFELPSSECFNLSRNWQTYEYQLDNLPLEFPTGGIFGDSSATLASVEFEDPESPTGLDTIIYFVDNFRLERLGETIFFEDFEAPLDIYDITIAVTEYWLDGAPEADPYEFSAKVLGDDITAVTMTTPDDDVYPLEAWDMYNWGLSIEDYPTLTDLRTAFPTGNYTFTFNGGADSVELIHNPTVPGGFANITYPVHNSYNIPLNPTMTWDLCVGLGDALNMAVAEELSDIGDVQWGIPIGTTTWTVGPLNPGLQHSLEVSVVTGFPASDQETNNEDAFKYYDLFENCNEVLFTTIPAIGTLTGWIWMEGGTDFGYSLDEGDLVYFVSIWPVWYYNFTTGLWGEEGPVGLVYANWPFIYESVPGNLWFALPPESGLWVYHFSNGQWVILPRIIP